MNILLRNESVGLNISSDGGAAWSNDHTELMWMDINGDGLPDCLDEDDHVAINLGYGFYYDGNQKLNSYDPTENSSRCFNISANLGFGGGVDLVKNNNKILSSVNHSFSANLSGSKSTNTGNVMYVDMNGDGLVDKLVDGDKLYYNRGWGYSNSYKQNLIGKAESKDISYNYGQTGNLTLGFSIPTFFGFFKIQSTDGMNTNSTASTTQSMLLDMNADGLPDIVARADDGTSIKVKYNRLYDVDKLVSVQSFYGNHMDISYEQAPYSAGARQRPTVMSGLTVSDSTLKSNDKRVYLYSYSGYVHSIEERTPYGFDSVIIIQYLDEHPYRITRQHYRTDLYKMRGRKASELMTDANGRPYVGNEWSYQLKLIENGNVVPVNMAHCYGATWPALDVIYTRYYNPVSGLIEIETAEKYNHIDSGRVGEYVNYNNTSILDDDVHCYVSYLRSGRNQSALPADMTVTNDAGELFRNRSARYDGNGRLATLSLYTDEYGLATESNYTYDDYGNILTVELPPNESGDRTVFEYTYDPLVHMFRTRTVDVIFEDTSSAEYDVRLGVPLRVYSKGGDSISYTYDGWGRPRTIRAPQECDTNNYPTIRYLYWDDTGSRAPQINLPTFRSFTGVRVMAGLLTEPECNYYKGWPIWAQTLHRSQVDRNLKVTTVLFADGHGRVLQTRKNARVNGRVEQVASGKIVYDDAGRPVITYEPFVAREAHAFFDIPPAYCDYATPQLEGVMTMTEYDVLDRVVRTEISPEDIVTEHFYEFDNANGIPCFRTETRDPEGHMSVALTDVRDLTLSSIDALQGETRFEYDALGQLVFSYDPDNFMTEYGYDKLGHLSYRVHPDAGTTQYSYDPAGNLIREDNPLGQIFYDYTHYRLASKRYSNMSGNDVTYEYGTEGTSAGLPVRILDGSGVQTLEYDEMGNVSKSVRVMSIPGSGNAYAFTHTFSYDSWGRMHNMTYPDGEEVAYKYYSTGELQKMTGEKEGHSRMYIKMIDYDKYGQRTRIDYGNGSHTEYAYDPLQRLSFLRSVDGTANHRTMQHNEYTFDKLNNIVQVHNGASDIGGLGGIYTNTYGYDELNRLVEAHGSGTVDRQPREFHINEMRYSASGRLGLKHQNWYSATTDGTQRMEYGYPGNTPDDKPHAPRLIEDIDANKIYGLEWDAAGNLIQVSAQGDDPAFMSRFLYWTEDNRLFTVADDRSFSYYAYDYTGQRTLKMAGDASLIDLNAWDQNIFSSLDRVTMYPSAYLVLSEHGYTKHYYVGTERVAARIGGGNLDHDTECIVDDGEAIDQSRNLFWQCSDLVNNYVIEHRDLGEMNIVNIDNNEMKAMGRFDMGQVPSMMKAEVNPKSEEIFEAIKYFSQPNPFVNPGDDDEPEVYFYHSDHLGGASWITDADGKAVQHLQYLPYGEPYVNQRISGYNERFTFTGKEKDEETGYGYFGARYMDYSLMTMWLSVDPMSVKYPSISPYAYCLWNPIICTDPSGMIVDTSNVPLYVKQVLDPNDKKNYNPAFVNLYKKMDDDPNTTYRFTQLKEYDKGGYITYGGKDGSRDIINIVFSKGHSRRADEGSLLEETYHAACQFYNGDLGFLLDKNGNFGTMIAYDRDDEVEAKCFAAQNVNFQTGFERRLLKAAQSEDKINAVWDFLKKSPSVDFEEYNMCLPTKQTMADFSDVLFHPNGTAYHPKYNIVGRKPNHK